MTRFEEAMDHVKNEFDATGKDVRIFMDEKTKIPNGGWTPVKDKLPEKNGNYLVTIKPTSNFSYVTVHYFGIFNNHLSFYDYFDGEYFELNCITAWMPLPAPYKEEKCNQEI